MIACRTPHEAYSRIACEARIHGAGPHDLAAICFDRFDDALHRALIAAARADNAGKSAALTRALAALAALQMGVDPSPPAGRALDQFYRAAQRGLTGCALAFDADLVGRIRADFQDVARSMLETR